MNPLEIKNLFDSEDTIGLVLEEMTEVLQKIEEYNEKSYLAQLDNPAVIDNALQIMCGCHGKLELLLAFSENALITKEADKKVALSLDKINEKGKVTTAEGDMIKNEATIAVQDYRKVNTILRNSVISCSTFISICQSRLKRIAESKQGREG